MITGLIRYLTLEKKTQEGKGETEGMIMNLLTPDPFRIS